MSSPSYGVNPLPAQAEVAVQPGSESVELEYHQLLRGGRWGIVGWWRVLVGVPLALILWAVPQLLALKVWTTVLAAQGVPRDDVVRRITDEVTPGLLVAINIGLAASIPSMMLVIWVMHRLRPGWTASVVGRIRWRWLLVCVALAVLALLATLVVSALLPQQGESTEMSGSLNEFTTQTRNFLLVVVLLTPLQAAGEEYAFRGYLTQAFGSLLAGVDPRVARGVAVVVPALLFATAHGVGQDLPIFFDRFAFGVVAGILVVATGGLEAGIAMHALNNVLAFGLALAFGDMTSALNPTGGSWWSLPVTLTQSVVYTVLAIAVARRMGIARRTAPLVLAPPIPRV